VLVEGTCVTHWSDLSGSDSLVIPSLLVRLQQVQALAQSKRSARAIMIQSDKSVAFSELKKVFYTCSRAGFSDFSILVIEQG
jgi:biopolymer transport protein ExbD